MRLASISTLALSLFAVAACTEAPAEEDLAAALEQENGGLDLEDEAPMFGADAEFADAAVEGESDGVDPQVNDPEVVALRERAGVARRRVMILWGQLPPDRTAEPRVWDGQLAINRGAMLVRREIGFEEPTDDVLARQVRTSVAFTSTTRPFADGLVLEVLDPDPASATPLTLTYTPRAGGAPLVFGFAALAAGPVSHDVGTGGDRMVATGLTADDACDHGFLRGRWHQVQPGRGRLLGAVADEDGVTVGHVRGLWGTRQTGDQLVFAKYISVDGQSRGLFVGTWDAGNFRGRWLVSSGDRGLVQGRYREGAPGTQVGGAFVGRWAETSCAAGL